MTGSWVPVVILASALGAATWALARWVEEAWPAVVGTIAAGASLGIALLAGDWAVFDGLAAGTLVAFGVVACLEVLGDEWASFGRQQHDRPARHRPELERLRDEVEYQELIERLHRTHGPRP